MLDSINEGNKLLKRQINMDITIMKVLLVINHNLIHCIHRHVYTIISQRYSVYLLGETCEMYATSHKRLFVPSVWGIRLLCDVKAEGPVSFMTHLQRSPTG